MSRTLAPWFGSALLLLAALPLLPAAQKDTKTDGANTAISLAQDAKVSRNLEILPLYLGGDGWPDAVAILQDVFDAPEDTFVPSSRKGADGRESVSWVGARHEALRQLAAWPRRDVTCTP